MQNTLGMPPKKPPYLAPDTSAEDVARYGATPTTCTCDDHKWREGGSYANPLNKSMRVCKHMLYCIRRTPEHADMVQRDIALLWGSGKPAPGAADRVPAEVRLIFIQN